MTTDRPGTPRVIGSRRRMAHAVTGIMLGVGVVLTSILFELTVVLPHWP